MRLGAMVKWGFEWDSPEQWGAFMRESGYGAAVCPIGDTADAATVRAYEEAAARADLVIAEVIGSRTTEFSSVDPDEGRRQAAIAYFQGQLDLADRIGARCCVGFSGSRGETPIAPSPDNLTDDTFALIVDTVREIVDGVDPRRTFYTLEPLPWIYPDSPESYLRLIEAVEREQFGVHLDVTNLISSQALYYGNTELTRRCFRLLGPHIRSCHAKDVRLAGELTVRIDEVRPGLGEFDYGVFLTEAERFDPDLPVILEHLPDDEEYAKATDYVRGIAEAVGVSLR